MAPGAKDSPRAFVPALGPVPISANRDRVHRTVTEFHVSFGFRDSYYLTMCRSSRNGDSWARRPIVLSTESVWEKRA